MASAYCFTQQDMNFEYHIIRYCIKIKIKKGLRLLDCFHFAQNLSFYRLQCVCVYVYIYVLFTLHSIHPSL